MARNTGLSFRWSVGTLAVLLMVLSLFGTASALFGTGSGLEHPHSENNASAASNYTDLNATSAQ